jgi:hypothetical protein
MRIRRRNWIIKRIALGFAVAALAAPAAAQARVDEGGNGQPNAASEIGVVTTAPGVLKPGDVAVNSNGFIPFVTDFPSLKSTVKVDAGDYGMPRAMPSDYALQRGDSIEIARTQPRSTLRTSDVIENVRVSPRDSGSTVEASPGLDWSDAGIGAGLAIAFYGTRHLGRAQTA